MVFRGGVLANASVGELLGGSRVPASQVIGRRPTLEDVYLQLTSGEAEFRAASDGEQGR